MDEIDIEQCMPAISRIAGWLKGRHGMSLSVEELCSAGHEVLVELAAGGGYDPARGDFWGYAYRRVVGAMIDEVERHAVGVISAHYRAALKAQLDAYEAATEPLAAKSLSTREMFREIWATMESTRIAYSVQIFGAATPESESMANEIRSKLRTSIGRLPEPQRTMMYQRYGEGLSLREVARNFGVSESRACHVVADALQVLRAELDPAT